MGCDVNWGCHVWIAIVAIDLQENVFSMSCELKLVELFLNPDCVFFVRCELRFEKQLSTVLFCVTMQHVVLITYLQFGKSDWPHLDFWFLDS